MFLDVFRMDVAHNHELPGFAEFGKIERRRGICTVVNTVEDACSRAGYPPFCAESKPKQAGVHATRV